MLVMVTWFSTLVAFTENVSVRRLSAKRKERFKLEFKRDAKQARNRVAAGVAELSGGGRGEGQRIEIGIARRVDRQSGGLRAQAAAARQSAGIGQVAGDVRRQRSAGGRGEIAVQVPAAQQLGLPPAVAQQAAHADRRGELEARGEIVALVEGGESALQRADYPGTAPPCRRCR